MTVNGDLKICCMNTSTQSVGNIFINDLNTLRTSGKIFEAMNALEENVQDLEHCKNCSYKTLSPLLQKIFTCD